MDGGWWLVDILSLELYTKVGCQAQEVMQEMRRWIQVCCSYVLSVSTCPALYKQTGLLVNIIFSPATRHLRITDIPDGCLVCLK